MKLYGNTHFISNETIMKNNNGRMLPDSLDDEILLIPAPGPGKKIQVKEHNLHGIVYEIIDDNGD